MMRWKLTLEYHGGGFAGWQRQANAISVQQVLEEAIEKFSGENVTLQAAGRTDAGVHARGQVAHFDLGKETNADEIMGAINFHARPHRVVIVKAETAPPDFNARLSAKSRSYRYRIINRRAPLALEADQAWHVAKPLSGDRMNEAAAILIGKHDFSTFRASNCQANSPLKTLDLLEVRSEGDVITIGAKARSFLYHQVRNMVGTLVLVGSGQWSIGDFSEAFKAADRTRGGPTAPAQGLCFWGVEY